MQSFRIWVWLIFNFVGNVCVYDIRDDYLWYYIDDGEYYYQGDLESTNKLLQDVIVVLWKSFRNSPLREVHMEKNPWKWQLVKLVSDDEWYGGDDNVNDDVR